MPEDEQPVDQPQDAPAPQPPQPQVAAQLTDKGLAITVQMPPIGVMIDSGMLTQIALQLIAQNEALADEIVKQRVAFLKQKRQELAVIKTISRSKGHLKAVN